MKKYADVSKVVYDPKGTDPFTFRWYDPDEVIAGKKMREHLKFALSYWHTIDAEGVDMFGSGTMDKSMGQTDPMAKFRAKADFAFELMEKLDIDYYCFHDVDIAPEGASREHRQLPRDGGLSVRAAEEDRQEVPVGHRQQLRR